jgi:hypothetical protein
MEMRRARSRHRADPTHGGAYADGLSAAQAASAVLGDKALESLAAAEPGLLHELATALHDAAGNYAEGERA